MIKSMIIRLFPTKDQEQKMWQHIGASRFIWNYMLALQQERYENGEKHLSAYDMNYLLAPLKRNNEYEWLSNVSHSTLQRSCSDLAKAYDCFFKKRSGFPKFKSRKKSKPSFPLRDDVGRVWFSETCVNVPTIGKVAYKTNYNIPLGNKIKFVNPRIQYTANHKWIITVGVECESQAPTLTDKPMGIDLGVKELAVVAFGDEQIVFHNKNKSKKVRQLRRKLKHLQRNLARKHRTNGSYEETNAIKELKDQIKRLYFHIANIQHDYIHQTTHELVSLLPCRVIMEDLNVKGMMKNRHLSRAVAEQCFYEFVRQMEYKCEWSGIEFVEADRFYPSSKTCSCCGSYLKNLKLQDRTYNCPVCGLKIDRDYNAAINLMNYKVQSST
jgi:putative transposase